MLSPIPTQKKIQEHLLVYLTFKIASPSKRKGTQGHT